MRIKIAVPEVTLGMYISGFGGGWLDHPFWRRNFLLQDVSDLERLRASQVPWVEIDTELGTAPADQIENAEPHRPVMSLKAAVEQQRAKNLANWKSEARPFVPPARLKPAERRAEMRKATMTVRSSRDAVVKLFEDAERGGRLPLPKVERAVHRISSSMGSNPAILLNIARIKNKDDFTFLHSVAVSALMINLGRAMRMDEATQIELGVAGMLHDVGKIGIPATILHKDEPLAPDEMQLIRNHPRFGHDLLAGSHQITPLALEVCLHHHERIDGRGYPHALTGENISLFARMGAICDVFDAMTSERPYKSSLPASLVLAHMQSWKGQFDQLVLTNFIDSLDVIPVGSIVGLRSGRRAVVVGENPEDMTQPIIRIMERGERPVEASGGEGLAGEPGELWEIVSIEPGLPDADFLKTSSHFLERLAA